MNPQPIGLASDLAPLQVMRCTVEQHDIAIWRSSRGVVNAWENRCPHRGMRLSYGFVRGESLACAYHGWHYNCAGQCHYIPAHPELTPPKTIRPVIFSVIEHAGLLWVDTSAEAQLNNEADTDGHAMESWVQLPHKLEPLRTLSFDCDAAALQNVMSDIAAPGDACEKTDVQTVSGQAMILCINAMGKAGSVYLVLHTPPEQPMLAHVLVHASLTVEERIQISRWCESLRRQAESL